MLGKFHTMATLTAAKVQGPVADEMTIEPKIDFRIQGTSRAEVEHEEEKSRKEFIGRHVHEIMHHPNKDVLKAELRSKRPQTPRHPRMLLVP